MSSQFTHLVVPYSRVLSFATPCCCPIQRAPKGRLRSLRFVLYHYFDALIRARRPRVLNSAHDKPRFIAVGQTAAKDASQLFHVGTEPDSIGRLVSGLATFTRIEGQDAYISTVADKLGENEWVHFACHGIPSQEKPFESAFALHDGRFTIQHITQCNL